MSAQHATLDGLSYIEFFESLIDKYFTQLYSPEKAMLLRRAYRASTLTILSIRAPFGKRSQFQFTLTQLSNRIGTNTSRDRAMSLYVDVDPAAQFIYTSSMGPGGGGSDYVGDGVGEQTVLGASDGIGARRFVLLPDEELWATQVGGPLGAMNVATEYF